MGMGIEMPSPRQPCLSLSPVRPQGCRGQGFRGTGWRTGTILGCLKIFFLSGYFRPKMQNLGLETSTLGEIMSKIEILSGHNLYRLKFAAVCRKIATSCPAYF